MARQIPWPRILAEGAVIIVSILLALAGDAWWDERRERAEEHEALVALAQDFDVAADRLGGVLATVDSIRVAAAVMLEWTGPRADARNGDSLAVLLPIVSRLPTFQPPLGSLEALLGSGDLRLIRNDSLRAALASFPSRLAGIHRTESYGAEQVFGELRPFLNRSVPMRRFARGGDGNTGFASDVVGLLRNLEFENQIQGRVTNIEYLSNSAGNMRTLVDEIRSMLASELEQAPRD